MAIIAIAEKPFHQLYHSLPLEGERILACVLQDARDFVQEHRADLILLDCGAEVERGLLLLSELKALAPEVPVVFIAADRSFDSVLAAFRTGARDFMAKPVNILELLDILELLLNMERVSQEKRTPVFLFECAAARNGPGGRRTTGEMPVFFRRVIRYIEENLSGDICLECLAQEAHLSKYHFSRLFSHYTGMAPLKYTTMVRMNRAKVLLEMNDMTVSMVSMKVGFNNLGTFIRRFKKLTGVTPTEYRNSVRKMRARLEYGMQESTSPIEGGHASQQKQSFRVEQ